MSNNKNEQLDFNLLNNIDFYELALDYEYNNVNHIKNWQYYPFANQNETLADIKNLNFANLNNADFFVQTEKQLLASPLLLISIRNYLTAIADSFESGFYSGFFISPSLLTQPSFFSKEFANVNADYRIYASVVKNKHPKETLTTLKEKALNTLTSIENVAQVLINSFKTILQVKDTWLVQFKKVTQDEKASPLFKELLANQNNELLEISFWDDFLAKFKQDIAEQKTKPITKTFLFDFKKRFIKMLNLKIKDFKKIVYKCFEILYSTKKMFELTKSIYTAYFSNLQKAILTAGYNNDDLILALANLFEPSSYEAYANRTNEYHLIISSSNLRNIIENNAYELFNILQQDEYFKKIFADNNNYLNVQEDANKNKDLILPFKNPYFLNTASINYDLPRFNLQEDFSKLIDDFTKHLNFLNSVSKLDFTKKYFLFYIESNIVQNITVQNIEWLHSTLFAMCKYEEELLEEKANKLNTLNLVANEEIIAENWRYSEQDKLIFKNLSNFKYNKFKR